MKASQAVVNSCCICLYCLELIDITEISNRGQIFYDRQDVFLNIVHSAHVKEKQYYMIENELEDAHKRLCLQA